MLSRQLLAKGVTEMGKATKGSDTGGRGGSGPERPDPNLTRCWQCGRQRPGGRKQCRTFRSLIRKNGGLPHAYKGACELHLEKIRGTEDQHVAALQCAKEAEAFLIARFAERDAAIAAAAAAAPAAPEAPSPAAAGNEHAETQDPELRWASGNINQAQKELNVCHKNIFQEIAADDDDHADLVDALKN